MTYRVPTLQELFEAHLGRIEGQINQTSPSNDKAFNKVLAASEAALDIGLYKFQANAALQNLALTATADGLDRIGNDNSTPRKQAQAAILTAEIIATTGTVILQGTNFVGDSNGIRYTTEADVTAAAGVAVISLRCTETGTDGNLDNGNILSISSQVAGAETTCEVTATTQEGINKESDADYRPRVLFAQRAVTGGGNASDHKIWAEVVTGVKRVFPYSGRPVADGDSLPGDRQIYVEANTDVDPDGIAPGSLLDDVRDAINIDPDTGLSRPNLGLTDDTLFIESIIRTDIYIIINNFDVSAENQTNCENDIETAIEFYLYLITPYVAGIDLIRDRVDTLTSTSVSRPIQDVLKSYGASATSIDFGLAAGVPETTYTLDINELVKLATGGILYV